MQQHGKFTTSFTFTCLTTAVLTQKFLFSDSIMYIKVQKRTRAEKPAEKAEKKKKRSAERSGRVDKKLEEKTKAKKLVKALKLVLECVEDDY